MSMHLRELAAKDAPLMLEWMHDKSVVRDLQTDFGSKTLKDCERFIEASLTDNANIHLAIVNDSDEYMGTVSLKHINADTAEFGITVRKKAMGTGCSQYGMREILRIAFEELGLKSVFWCVSPDNGRAVRFYEKSGYKRIDMSGKSVEGYTRQQTDKYIWYEITDDEFSCGRK